MKTLVVYDSVYGNTEKVAHAIGDAIAGDVSVLQASSVSASALESIDLIIVGAPTQGGRPTPPVQELIDRLPAAAIAGKRFAAFDTRLRAKWVKIFSYAAPRMVEALSSKGGKLIGAPTGFVVKGRRGPLEEGELERAAGWAREIAGAAG